MPEEKFYLVDSGYANTSSFIAPYRGVRYHLSEFRGRRSYANYKELFNHRHAILRSHIERAIGVWKKRFPILKVGTFYPIESQVKIPAATVIFHNMIKSWNGEEGWLDHLPSNIEESQYVNLSEGEVNHSTEPDSIDGSSLRDQIALQMWAAHNA